MSDLQLLYVTDSNIRLDKNIVKGGILPNKIAELKRTVNVAGETMVEGPIYADKLTIEAGPFEVTGATFVQHELYINNDVNSVVTFRKAVGSSSSIVSRANNCKTTFCSDVNSKKVVLYNTFITGSVYGDEIELENCVVIGGVFATQSLELKNSIVGTFVSPYAKLAGNISLLLPSVFSIEGIVHEPDTKLYSLALADLGALYRGLTQAHDSGKIQINIDTDDLRTTLVDGESRRTLHSYSVIGKVLAADMIDSDKFQNHFLLTAAALGPQLLKTYDLGLDSNGNVAVLTVEKIREFFFDVLWGKISIQEMDGKFSIDQFARTM